MSTESVTIASLGPPTHASNGAAVPFGGMVASPQTLNVEQRRTLAGWAARCVEQGSMGSDSAASLDVRVQAAIDQTRAFADGRLAVAEAIRQRGGAAGSAARESASPAGRALAYAAEQAASVAHMGAHAFGAAGYSVKAQLLAAPNVPPGGASDFVAVRAAQLVADLSADEAEALLLLPLLATDRRGPLAPGRLSTGAVGESIRAIQQLLIDQR